MKFFLKVNMIKFSLVLCVFAFAKLSSADLFYDVAKEQWSSFKADYNKEYKNDIEESFRFKVYMTNMKRILEHNRRYKAGNETYSMKMNQFGDLFEHEIIGTMMGLNYTLMKEELNKSKGINYVPPANVKLPTYVNWAEQGAVTPVKNQGQCGSCWAFSSTGSLEGQHFRATKQLITLSEQNLVDCSGSYGNNGCGGGWMTTSFSYIKDNNGIDTEQGYAYEARDGPCRFNKSSVGATDKGFVSIPAGNEDMLMSAVATIGPIAVALDASTFSFYHEGIFFDPNCYVSYRLNHGVLAVGYGKETIQGKEIDYWIIKNSWGTSWGMQGYMKMLKYQNMCHIADAASYPVV